MARCRTALAAALLATLVAAALPVTASAQSEPRIAWRVENPFRFFQDAADTEVHRQTVLALPAEERRIPVLASERALASRHGDGWAATMYQKVCWDGARNLHVCPDGSDYASPRSHTVIATVEGVADAATVDCVWQSAPRGRAAPRGMSITRPCDQPVAIDVPYPAGAIVSASVGGIPIAEAKVSVQDLLVVAMGDSFGSGEGNPDAPVRFSRERTADYANPKKFADLIGYPARVGAWKQVGDKAFMGENARWLDQACHRSLYSHQLRAALQIALEDPHRAVTFAGVACSGAEVTAGLFLRYKGHEWVPNPPELSQISAIAEVQCGRHEAPLWDLPEAYHINGRIPDLQGGLVLKRCPPEHSRRIDLVLVSIGGNDVGFARLVANAILDDATSLRRLGGWFGHVHGKKEAELLLEQLDERYKSLNRALHNILHLPWSESDRVILAAYPGMALLDDGRSVCPDGRAGMEVLPDFKLSTAKALEGEEVAGRLNTVMRASARAHGWSFADAHRAHFLGRGICAGYSDSAFSIADDLRLPRRNGSGWEPFNPADYQPYAPRQRWFRTPNDAFMTGNFHVSESLLQKALKFESLSWFQVLLASTYSGAFHPTAEGHAAIADAVADKARAVLEKYSGRNQEK